MKGKLAVLLAGGVVTPHSFPLKVYKPDFRIASRGIGVHFVVLNSLSSET